MSRRPKPPRTRPARAQPRRNLIGRLFGALLWLILIVGFVGPVAVVVVYRFVPPPMTWLMVQRMVEGRGFDRQWVPLKSISPTLVRAVIAADRVVPHGRVVQVIDIVRLAGISRFAIQTELPSAAQGGP